MSGNGPNSIAKPATRKFACHLLYTPTRHLALQRIRTERRRLVRERAAMMIADNDHSPQLEAERLQPFIDGVLDRLRESDREVILLRFYRGRAFADIGERLGISEDAARFRLTRALERLKRLLLKSGIRSSPAALTLVIAGEANAAANAGFVEAVSRAALSHASAATPSILSPLTQFFHLMNSAKTIASVAVLLACTGGLLLHSERTELLQIRAELASHENPHRRLIRELAEAKSVRTAGDESSHTPAKSNLAASTLPAEGASPAASNATNASTISPSVDVKPMPKDRWQYERRAPAKAAAETVAALVFDSGAPLTTEQTSALTGAILQNSAKFRQGGQVSLDDIDKPAVLEQLSNILTAEQLAALQMSWTARESGPKLTRLISEALKPARDGK